MRKKFILLWVFMCSAIPAWAQVNLSFGFRSEDLGISLRLYPELIPVPGYPVYYAPQLNSNYFFYDGMYWVYQGDEWYASTWYNGPWGLVSPEVVPVFILRIPVRYYRQTPVYFRGWQLNAAPRWNEHWGNEWAQRRRGWDRWNRSMPATRPPLPVYQRNYSGDRYPQVKQQQILQNQYYRYQPHDPLVRQQVQAHRKQNGSEPVQPRTQSMPQERNPRLDELHKPSPPAQQNMPAAPPEQVPPAAPVQQVQPPHQRQNPYQQAEPKLQHPEPERQNKTIQQELQREPKPEREKNRDNPKDRADERNDNRNDERGQDRKK